MARIRIQEFGTIQKTLAGASVAVYEADDNGSSLGVLAKIYQDENGTGERTNPQVLNEWGKLENDCWVEVAVMAAITNISETTERNLKKIRANPLQYPLFLTSAGVYAAGVDVDAAAAQQAASTATAAAATSTANAATTTANVATTNAGAATATTKAAEALASAQSAAANAALLPKNNFNATAAPTTANNASQGYSAGSQWLNTTNGNRYLCNVATVSTATWQDITGIDVGDLGNMAFETKTDYYAKSEVASIRQIPQNAQNGNYTAVLADGGKHISHNHASTHTYTIPRNADVAYPVGTAITFVNRNGAGDLLIAINTDTMRLVGLGTTGTRTLAENGIATALKVDATEWIISGTGLS